MRSAAVKVGAAILLLSLLPAHLYAADTQVNFAVCGDGSGSSISITTPLSDSVGNSPEVTLQGTVKDATQIDISVDGAYSNTVPLNVTDTSFTTTLELTPGTHTITLVANDVCQNRSGSDTIVITYEKKASPAPGVSVPTDIGGGQGGVHIYPQTNQTSSDPVPILQPLTSLGGKAGEFLVNNLDLRPAGNEKPATVATRVFLAVSGLAVMLFGPVIALWHGVRSSINLIASRTTGIRTLLPAVPSRKINIAIRSIGAVLFVLSLAL